jgi:ABC-type lipoprotein export system ATPase subunit
VNAVDTHELFVVHSTHEGEAAALQGLSLAVTVGELLVVLGPSGSGKTTFLRVLAGYARPSSGRVRVFGEDVTSLTERRLAAYRARTLGYLDQHYWRVLSPEVSVLELVGLQLALRGVPGEEWRSRASGLLAAVALRDKASGRIDSLSGGEQQRVALCAALAHRPPLLLADEPTGELDADTAIDVYRLMRKMTRALGCTTIVVTHDERWRALADRVVRIRDGRVTEEMSEGDDGRETLVVDARGWVRLPERVRVRARLGLRVHVEASDESVVLRPARNVPDATARTAGPELAPRAKAGHGETPADVLVRGVTKSYGDTVVLNDVTAEFRAGSFHVVTGPSGSGKTTLLRLVAGMELLGEGEISIAGEALSQMKEAARTALRRTEVAYVSQQSLLIEHLSARENVALGLSIRGRRDAESVDRALDLVGLGPRTEHRLRRLSTGERARVALARGLASGARVLVLDEPTSRLDQENARFVGALLARVAREVGACVICATHDPEVIALADDDHSLLRESATLRD